MVTNVAKVKQLLACTDSVGLEPNDLLALAAECGYLVRINLDESKTKSDFSVIFHTNNFDITSYQTILTVFDADEFKNNSSLNLYANSPDTLAAKRDLPRYLREHLQDRLPDYMVPGVLMVLDEFPLTPNGKLDRNALPSPEPGVLTDAYVAPRTDIELTLSQIWSEVLGVDRVGIHDNFFELGGHSLLATRVISALRQHFEIELPLRNIFESPTVSGLVVHVVDEQAQSRWSSAPPLSPVPREQALPLSYAQQRLWFLDQLEPGSAFYNMPVSVELLGRLDLKALRQTFSALVERHESLRTVFTMDAGEAVQQIRTEITVPLPVIDLSGLAAPERLLQSQLLAQSESVKPFNLSTGPLLRVQVLKLEDERHHLLLSLHHIVSDAWSMGVLLREVAHLYEAYRLGKSSALLPLPVQYVDYAVWQREWLQARY